MRRGGSARCVEGAVAPVGERPCRWPCWKGSTRIAENGGRGSARHESRLHAEHDPAGHQEEEDDVKAITAARTERQMGPEAVFEGRRNQQSFHRRPTSNSAGRARTAWQGGSVVRGSDRATSGGEKRGGEIAGAGTPATVGRARILFPEDLLGSRRSSQGKTTICSSSAVRPGRNSVQAPGRPCTRTTGAPAEGASTSRTSSRSTEYRARSARARLSRRFPAWRPRLRRQTQGLSSSQPRVAFGGTLRVPLRAPASAAGRPAPRISQQDEKRKDRCRSSTTSAPSEGHRAKEQLRKIASDATAAATVSELNSIARPKVASVRHSASTPKP